MSRESLLAIASLLLTYLFKTTVVYLLLSLLCRFIRNSQVCFWLHGLFLATTVTAWLFVLLSFNLPGLPSRGGLLPDTTSSGHLLSWSIESATLPYFAKGLSIALLLYGVIVTLLLAQLLSHHWRFRSFVKASQPAPDALAFQFELVRSSTQCPGCELRLVDGLRSPATAGWTRPRVLLPRDLLPRLHARQLMHIFQHELTHVRRRDYLWDRLSTIGCSLIFFHPVAWLARRALRWERELLCDQSVAAQSPEGRLEYASCLTTLAAWWFLQENPAGPVDFLSPRSSLLTARVRALLANPPLYGPRRKIPVTMLAACSLVLAAVLVPEMVISSNDAPVLAMARLVSPSPALGVRHARRHKGQRLAVPGFPKIAAVSLQGASLPDLNFANSPAVLPKLSPEVRGQKAFETDESETFASSGSNSAAHEYSRPPVWDESIPHAPRRRRAKVGAVALHVIRLGVALAASQIGDHEHEKEP